VTAGAGTAAVGQDAPAAGAATPGASVGVGAAIAVKVGAQVGTQVGAAVRAVFGAAFAAQVGAAFAAQVGAAPSAPVASVDRHDIYMLHASSSVVLTT